MSLALLLNILLSGNFQELRRCKSTAELPRYILPTHQIPFHDKTYPPTLKTLINPVIN